MLLHQQHYSDSIYNLNDGLDNLYSFESNNRSDANSNSSGSTALYHHNGSRYGLGLSGRANGADSKMNGLHGPKRKRGDVDRECEYLCLSCLICNLN
jgi:hypothetical protein